MKNNARNPLSPAHQRGVTLVELMVGMALAMLVAVALLQLLADTSANGQNVARASSQIENGRYAAELLRDDLQLAGYFGEIPVFAAAYSNPSPCAVAATDFVAAPVTYPPAVQGFASAESVACLQNRRAGSDALVVRRLNTVPTPVASLSAANTQYFVQYSFCVNDPAVLPLVFDKAPVEMVLRNRACTAGNTARAYVSRTYFLADCNDCSGAGDGIPTLKRLDLVDNTSVITPLVEGVETLRFEYGFDTNGDGAVDEFRTALGTGAAGLWQNVVTLRLHYVVRSVDKVVGSALAGDQTFSLGGIGTLNVAGDGHVRRAYSTTVPLVNVAGAREQQ
jgi:type IV pilus assembly protein PilW